MSAGPATLETGEPETPAQRGSGGDRALRITIAVVALVGLGIAAYLTYVHYEGLSPVCGLGGDCEKVQTSEQSEVAGIPVALLGVVGYVLILVSTLLRGDLGRFSGVTFAFIGFLFSAYLTYAELFEIEAICPWCVASAVLMTLLAVLTAWRLLRAP